MSIETNVHTPWNTQIFDCLNPEHAPIKQGLLDFIYQYERRSAEALKAEGRRRAENGEFFGYMAYANLTATKP